MLEIKKLAVKLKENNKEILKDINLCVNDSEVHLLTGKNGSGKSSLVNAIMGNPDLEITKGKIYIDDKEVSQSAPNEKALAGLFLANQHPVEIPGVSLTQYLRLLYNIRKDEKDKLPVFKFRKLLEQKAEEINYPKHLLTRNLNEGFSGGEKKKTEILQMLICEPKYIMLDEIDSGLDKQSIQDVFQGLKKYKEENPKTAFIIITHYDKVLEFLTPDFTHTIENKTLTAVS